ECDRFFQVEQQVEQRGIGRITLSNTRELGAAIVEGGSGRIR
ncbi:unnamed protein product, partial [marine sediment metagenome]